MPDTCKALIMGDAIYPYLPPLLINRPCAQNPSMRKRLLTSTMETLITSTMETLSRFDVQLH